MMPSLMVKGLEPYFNADAGIIGLQMIPSAKIIQVTA